MARTLKTGVKSSGRLQNGEKLNYSREAVDPTGRKVIVPEQILQILTYPRLSIR